MQRVIKTNITGSAIPVIGVVLLLLHACSTSSSKGMEATETVPVISVDTTTLVTHQQYAGSLEGVADVEIRPQVEGYLEKIFVDEGAYVQKGQSLFLINDKPYNEQLNSAGAALKAAKANVAKAQIEVARLEKLVDGKVISQVQLDNARASLEAANATVSQTEAQQKAAAINKGFTLIKAPINGYIGRIPFKVGSLIGRNEQAPLTMLSDIHKMYVYFAMSEKDFLQFKQQYSGASIEEKLANIPPVTLVLPDNSVYPETGKVETVQGQFDKATAAITFRASFPNTHGLLRSGNTGVIILSQRTNGAIQIPQAATFEIQNKVLVYKLDRNNRIINSPVTIADKNEVNYIISEGLQPGDRIVARGLDRLRENMQVNPALK